MTTRRQLERVIVRQAICESAAFDQAEFLQRELDEQRRQRIELSKERAALLAENAELRADVEWLEAVVHELVDSRVHFRRKLRQYEWAGLYDLGRKTPASEEAHEIWNNIVDKPHWALPEIQDLLNESAKLRSELKRAKGRKR